MANIPIYPVDTTISLVQPPSSIYNPNVSGVVVSSFGTSAVNDYEVFYQSFNFNLTRQNIIIPNGSYFDTNVAVPVGTNFSSNATHNRIVVQGQLTLINQIIPNSNFSQTNTRIPQTFVAYGTASGTGGNGIYTSGNGVVNTYQPGYYRSIATPSTTQYNRTIYFTVPILLQNNSWNPNTSFGDSINNIIYLVAQEIKQKYASELRLDLLFV